MIRSLPVGSRRGRCAILAALAPLCPLMLLSQATPVAATNVQSETRQTYVFFGDGSRSSMMSGSMKDMSRASSLRRGNEALLYVQHGTAAYVIRDPATLRQAAAILEPQQIVGAQQAELGSRQAALGSRQAALGAEQARLGHRLANAPVRRAAELGRQQGELGRRQGALGEQQSALGEQQAALGREQARLAHEAQAKLRDLVAGAVQRGVAERVD